MFEKNYIILQYVRVNIVVFLTFLAIGPHMKILYNPFI